MRLAKTSFERIFALALLVAFAACDSDSQTVAVEEVMAEKPADPVDPAELAAIAANTAISSKGNEIFIAESPDTFSPGAAIGDRFPSIRAMYQGEEITSIDPFIGDRGAIFIAVRSVNW